MQAAAYIVHGIGHQGLVAICDNCSNAIDGNPHDLTGVTDKEFCDAECAWQYLEERAYEQNPNADCWCWTDSAHVKANTYCQACVKAGAPER